MLRWFRQYNAWILSIGVSLLMVAFLVEPALRMFQQDPGDEVIGTLDGVKVRRSAYRQAEAEWSVIQRAGLALFAPADDALHWMLMVQQARALGLKVSRGEVAQTLALLGLLEESRIEETARQLGVTPGTLRQALADWLIVQEARELLTGRAHVPLTDRVRMLGDRNLMLMMQYGLIDPDMLVGSPRASEPVMKRLLYDGRATVKIDAVLIGAAKALDQVGQPDAELMTDLYERHKDSLPGRSEPHGFGYRSPERVKVEYLIVPLEPIRERAVVDEADALAYYDQNKSQFKAAADPSAKPGESGFDASLPVPGSSAEFKPYEEVRRAIIDRLKDERARAVADKAIKAARAVLLSELRSIPEDANYRVFPEGYVPTGSLRSAAETIQQQFAQEGVRTQVVGDVLGWLESGALPDLPGIGKASTSAALGQRRVPFAVYALSARELEPVPAQSDQAGARDAASARRLPGLPMQTHVPSVPLEDDQGNRYLFRLTGAQAERSPQSLEEVKDRVEEDARMLLAYRLLGGDEQRQSWLDKARGSGGLSALAGTIGVSPISPPPFPRRQMSMGGGAITPEIDGIGRDAEFVDRVFQAAVELAGRQGGLSSIDPAERTLAVPVAAKLSLALVRIDEFKPVSKSDYERAITAMAQQQGLALTLNQALAVKPEDASATDAGGSSLEDPLSARAIAARLNFQSDMLEVDRPRR